LVFSLNNPQTTALPRELQGSALTKVPRCILRSLGACGTVVIYMFVVGLALSPRELPHTAVLTSHVSIIAPFVLGAMLALCLYPRLSDDSVSFTSIALFIGAVMSITAFPVLARILTDRDMLGTKLGLLAIACAAVDDVTGWCISPISLFWCAQREASTPLWVTLAGLVTFLLLMVYGVRAPARLGKDLPGTGPPQ
jgi:Kef-type K+ transport system membrane component KefB